MRAEIMTTASFTSWLERGVRAGLAPWLLLAGVSLLTGCGSLPGGTAMGPAPLVLDDFSQVIPQEAITSEPSAGKWWRTSASGRPILFAAGEAQLPPLTYPLTLQGWYDISIGLVEKPYPVDDAEWQGIHVKLTSDPWYTHIQGGRTGLGREMAAAQVDEIYWKRANLSHENVVIYQPFGRFFRPAGGIAYIKLVPLTEAQVLRDRQRTETILRQAPRKSVAGMADFWSYVFVHPGAGQENTRSVIDQHRKAGFDTIYFQINADGLVHYPSKVAQPFTYEACGDPRVEAKAYDDMLRNHDPLKVASEYARQQGITFIPWFRVTNEQSQTNPRIEYIQKFKALWTRGADGELTRWPSLAYPEVREYKLAIIRELLTDYAVDGIMLDYLRTLPVIGYEPPVVEAYDRRYGTHLMSDLNERASPRWKRFRAAVVTDFMRQVKQIALAAEKKQGRHLQVVARVAARDNLWKGMDVETWIKEGLIDVVVPSNYTFFDPPVPVKPFVDMARGTGCKVCPNLNPFFAGGTDDPEHDPNKDEKEAAEIIIRRVNQGSPSNPEYMRAVLDCYAQGADGVVFYESEVLTAIPPQYLCRAELVPLFQSLASPAAALNYARTLEQVPERP
jgi:hypothetical protein